MKIITGATKTCIFKGYSVKIKSTFRKKLKWLIKIKPLSQQWKAWAGLAPSSTDWYFKMLPLLYGVIPGRSGCYGISHITACSDIRDVGTSEQIQPRNPVNTGLLLGVKTYWGHWRFDLPTCKSPPDPRQPRRSSSYLAIDVCRG